MVLCHDRTPNPTRQHAVSTPGLPTTHISLHRKWRIRLDKKLRRYTDLIGSLDVVIVEKLKNRTGKSC